MYRCNSCGSRFEYPSSVLVVDNNAGFSSYRVSCESVCPDCQSSDYEECTECSICGKDVLPVNCEYGVCDSCLELLEHKATRILKEHLDADEFDAIRQWLDLPEVV